MKGLEAPVAEEAEESAGPDPQAMLEQGKQLCQIGESIIAAAQAMGAVDAMEEGPMEEEAPMEADAGYEEEEAPSATSVNPKINAIIIAAKKKLGKK